MENTTRTQKKHDHRLKDLVRSTRDITCAVRHGVDARGSKLFVNEEEAARVRGISELYLEHQAMLPVVHPPSARTSSIRDDRWVRGSCYATRCNVTTGGASALCGIRLAA